MSVPRFTGLIEELARDRVSGASELALRAARILAEVPARQLSEAAGAVMAAQPAMAPVYNAAQAALRGTLADFTAQLERSGDVIARKAQPLLRGKSVLTHSYSSTVLRALEQGGPSRVICTESLPGGEGRRTAASIGGEVVADAMVYTALARADIVIFGADAITPDAVINKTGTTLIALAARERGLPAWILCARAKFADAGWRAKLSELFEAAPRTLFTGIVDDGDVR